MEAIWRAIRRFVSRPVQINSLDVGFDLPSGGAFRVIDVIVTEAPRFDADLR